MHDAVTDWKELSALYEKADQLSAVALEAWLATLREPPHPLLGQLLQMLGARSEIRDNGFLDALPPLTLAASGSAAATRGEWQSGARIGPYRLEARLGAGGMAEVWRAQRDDGAFARTVAIKLLFRHVGGPRQQGTFAQRFSRERDILATLHHPNIAALHDAGVTASGQPWLALEYVEGQPLTAWCDRMRLGVRGRVELFGQVLLAVQHAHANLVIHRDLKPANILVTTAGQVRLLDFGIAKLMEEGGDALADTELTRHAGRMMTVRYASPEQLTGQPLTTACDVYSLGVVLYELLCGHLPYETKVETPAQLEQAILEVEPRPPSRRALTSAAATARGGRDGVALHRLLGNELDAVVLRALAKRPADRYASVEALRVELERWLAGEPVEARAPTRAYRLRKFVGRHVVGVSLGSAAVLSLVAVATVAVWLGLQARQESARATAARDFMMGMFKQADSDKAHGADMTARQLLDRGRDDVLVRLKGQPELQADLLEGIADIQLTMGEYSKAERTFDELSGVFRRSGQVDKSALALTRRADAALRMFDLKLAQALVEKVNALPAHARSDPKLRIGLGLTTGWLAIWNNEPERARTLFEENLERSEVAFGKYAHETLSALVGAVQAEARLRHFDAALALQGELRSRQMQVADRTPRDVVDLDVGHADLLYLAGQFKAVATLTGEAIPRCFAALGNDDASCRRLVSVGSGALLRLGSADAVRSRFAALRAMADDSTAPGFQLSSLLTLFRARSQLDQLADEPGLDDRLRTLAASPPAMPINAMQQVMVLQALAEDALRRGRADEAERWLTRATELRPQSGDSAPGFAATAMTQMYTGIGLLMAGRAVDSVALLRLAQAGQARVLGASHPLAVLYSLNTAEALAAAGLTDEARTIVDPAVPVLRQAYGTESPTFQRLVALQSQLGTLSRPPIPTPAKVRAIRSADEAAIRSPSFFN